MKKAWLLLLTAALLAVLVGCQKPSNELPPVLTDETTEPVTDSTEVSPKEPAEQTEMQTEAVTEPQTEPQTEPETEPETESSTESQAESETDLRNDPQPELDHSVSYHSVEELLRGLWKRQNAQSGDVGTNSGSMSVSTVYPVLKKTDINFKYVDIVPNIRVEYVFCPIDRHIAYVEERTVFEVYFSDLYSGYFAEMPRNEYGAFYNQDFWWFQIEGYTVAVHLPSNLYEDVPPFEDVYEYFSDFEIVTYSPTAETGAVQ